MEKEFVTRQDSHFVFADIVGDETARGQWMNTGPLLEVMDNLAAIIAGRHSKSGVVTVSIDRVDMVNAVCHGDLVRFEGQILSVGRSSITIQISCFRHDKELEQFNHTHSCILTMVAVDMQTLRPVSNLKGLFDASRPDECKRLHEMASQRKLLTTRWQKEQDEVDKIHHITEDMIRRSVHAEKKYLVSMKSTTVMIQNVFLPKHKNMHGTIFGGTILKKMDAVALYCATSFTQNEKMVTISMNRLIFKRPITIAHVVTMVARVVDVRQYSLEVEIEVFVTDVTEQRKKSHTGYFTVLNLGHDYRKKCILKGLKVEESDQESMKVMLKAQRRKVFDNENKELFLLPPLALSVPESRL